MIKLSYINSDDRRYNIERCLSLIKTEITKGLRDAKSVIIKPDCTVLDNQLACTHVDALQSVISSIRPYVKGQITLAENCIRGETSKAFDNYGYFKLQDLYDVAMIDLSTDDYEIIELLDRSEKVWQARISKTLLNSDYIISVCPPKTHRQITYTGAINNVVQGSLCRTKKSLGHFLGIGRLDGDDRDYAYRDKKIREENIKRIAGRLKIQLAVIDAYEVMEGDGPLKGELVPGHFCITGTDPASVDALACRCIGMDLEEIDYLRLMEPVNTDNFFVIGDDWKKNILEIKLPAKPCQ